MRFAYGQISKKRHFVRKIRVKSWCISQNKKKSAPSLARISNHCSVVALASTPCPNRVSPHNPLVPSTLARARRAYPSQARLGYAGAERSASHLVNRVQTSNKAHDKFVPRRDCADHSRPSLSPALLSGWSSHLTFPSSSSTTIIVRKSRRCLNCRNP